MRHMAGPKITYAFLILAVGLMLTDLCKLVRTPSEPVLAVPTGHTKFTNFKDFRMEE